MKIAIGTVIYQSSWIYRNEFVKSINEQTVSNFEVLIVNDGIDDNGVYELRHALKTDSTVVDEKGNKTISEIRKILLTEAKKRNVDLLILCDFDDVFDRERVFRTVSALESDTCIYYNNIKTFSGETIFKNLPERIYSFNDILEYNFLGLSNTSLNMGFISIDFISKLKNVNTNVFDWYFFSKLLLDGKSGKLIDNAYTYYRIRENNIAGINKNQTEDIEKEILIKRCQYGLLKDETPVYRRLYEHYTSSASELEKKRQTCNNGYWWSCLKYEEVKNVSL